MSNVLLTVTEAIKAVPVSESTLRRDIKAGKVSFEKDSRGHKRFHPAELQRAYGDLNLPRQEQPETATDPPPEQPLTATDSPKVVALLEAQLANAQEQLADAKELLAQAHEREKSLTAEKSEIVGLAKGLQEQNALLMLPPPEEEIVAEVAPHPEPEPEPKRPIRIRNLIKGFLGIETS